MAALESDPILRGKLSAIGLQPMADWVKHQCQTSAIPGWIIVQCAACLRNTSTWYLGRKVISKTHHTSRLNILLTTWTIMDSLTTPTSSNLALEILHVLAPEVTANTAENKKLAKKDVIKVALAIHLDNSIDRHSKSAWNPALTRDDCHQYWKPHCKAQANLRLPWCMQRGTAGNQWQTNWQSKLHINNMLQLMGMSTWMCRKITSKTWTTGFGQSTRLHNKMAGVK